jgi:GNAT superfamily N-acetyltransferase
VQEAGEILTLQRAAYVSEAQLYGDVRLPALTQTLDDLRTEIGRSLCLKATIDGRLVGAVRARVDGEVMHIGRLIVAPDLQGRGIGTLLLRTVEGRAPDGVRRLALFTGHLSAANLRLYEHHGYVETRRESLGPDVVLVHLEKSIASARPRLRNEKGPRD